MSGTLVPGWWYVVEDWLQRGGSTTSAKSINARNDGSVGWACELQGGIALRILCAERDVLMKLPHVKVIVDVWRVSEQRVRGACVTCGPGEMKHNVSIHSGGQ